MRLAPVLALLLIADSGCGGDGDGGSLSAGASASATDQSGTSAAATTVEPSGTSSGGGGSADTTVASSSTADPSATTSGTAEGSSSGSPADTSATGTAAESSSSDGGLVQDGVIDVTIYAHDDCTITTDPASIDVPEGTEFTVNWISAASSVVEVDVAKIDDFNQVPIILGMEPGTSYHDEVRVWCGALFTGTFDFRVTSCFDPQYLPVDCSA